MGLSLWLLATGALFRHPLLKLLLRELDYKRLAAGARIAGQDEIPRLCELDGCAFDPYLGRGAAWAHGIYRGHLSPDNQPPGSTANRCLSLLAEECP